MRAFYSLIPGLNTAAALFAAAIIIVRILIDLYFKGMFPVVTHYTKLRDARVQVTPLPELDALHGEVHWARGLAAIPAHRFECPREHSVFDFA